MAIVWGRGTDEGGDAEDMGAVEREEWCDECWAPLTYPFIRLKYGENFRRLHPLCAVELSTRLTQEASQALSGFESFQYRRASWMASGQAQREYEKRQAKRFVDALFGCGSFSKNFLIDWIRRDHRLEGMAGVGSYLEARAKDIIRDLMMSRCIRASGDDLWELVAPIFHPQPTQASTPAGLRLDPQRNFTALQKKEILMRANGHCVGCGTELGLDWHADHIFPHSRGGRTEVVNGQALCQPCNSRKHAKVLTVDG